MNRRSQIAEIRLPQRTLMELCHLTGVTIYNSDLARWLDGQHIPDVKQQALDGWLNRIALALDSGMMRPDLRDPDVVRSAVEYFESRTATREIASSHFEILFAAGAAQ